MEIFEREHIIAWIKGLNQILCDITNSGGVPIVIAISRKMPRMFDWLRHQTGESWLVSADTGIDNISKFVDRLNITTEYALPFLFYTKPENEDKYEFIVVDDIIIHGFTLRQVSSDIFALTGKRPIASAIFKCENVGAFPYADTSLIDKITPLTKGEENKANTFISRAILSTSLPMDMVYPIFHVKKDILKEFNKKLSDKCEEYFIQHEKSPIISETIMLDKYIAPAVNNDFAKCRSFYTEDEDASFVVYSPNVVEEDIILSGCPFANRIYSDVWETILKFVKTVNYMEVKERMKDSIYSYAAEKRIVERIALSLDAFANYLFSISIINYVRSKIEHDDGLELHLKIQESDLRLLLGKDASSEVVGKINDILKNCEISPSKREQIVLENSLCPKDFKEKYEQYKNVIIQRSGTLEGALNDIFDLQRYPEKLGLYLAPNISPESAGIAESFQSMIDLLSKFKSEDYDITVEVNKYIDKRIDEGAVSSFYSRTYSPGKIPYIKRFFRAGANSMV